MDTQTFSSISGKKKKREWTAVMHERTERESWPFIIRRGFTESQRKELHEQAVIHRHISEGLKVPLQLVLPLLKTVVSSLGPISFQNQYPSLLKCGNMTEEEPGRCRRTDGKKWRCRRDVISGQKYCETHIHRGRHRSRKLVEQPLSDPSVFAAPKPQFPPHHHHHHHANPAPPVVSVGLQLMTTPSPAHAGATSGTVIKLKKPRGSGFSPKSVLQGSQLVMGGSGVGDEVAAGDWRRCRRTDGKKWRCRREVILGQKYCQSHMHRGAKKQPRGGPPDTSLSISIRPPGPAPVEEEETSSSDTTITDTSN